MFRLRKRKVWQVAKNSHHPRILRMASRSSRFTVDPCSGIRRAHIRGGVSRIAIPVFQGRDVPNWHGLRNSLSRCTGKIEILRSSELLPEDFSRFCEAGSIRSGRIVGEEILVVSLR